MGWIVFFALLFAYIFWVLWRGRHQPPPAILGPPSRKNKTRTTNVVYLPEKFIVFDLETTGLNPSTDEIIEIGAIRVNRDSDHHETFQTLVKHSKKKLPAKIVALTGISQEMIDADGVTLDSALRDFFDFAGDWPLVAFNAKFDMGFIQKAALKNSLKCANSHSCALEMARKAWPGLKSYKLTSLCKDEIVGSSEAHRALADCKRALIVYAAAVAELGTAR